MKKVKAAAVALLLTVTLACASAQKAEFKTVSVAVAGVEVARAGYYDLDHQCLANPATTTLCPKIVAAHDSLRAAYIKYQQAVKALADANIAVINVGGNPAADAKVAAAISGLIAVAEDFVILESAVTGGK